MAAYIIVRADVTDWEKYRQYLNVTPALIEKFGGKAIARAGKTVTLEGPEENRRIVLLEFPSAEKAKAFYFSPEYQEARKLRENAAIGELILTEGI
jgi:uncharacterized protein (DUF1330 family)